MNIDVNYHVPIMVDEILENLITNPDGIYVDGTLGGGGHSSQILKNISKSATLIGIDRDIEAIEHADTLCEAYPNFVCIHDNFHNIMGILTRFNISKIDGCLLDLGVSSHQIDTEHRGFSYNVDAHLDMRMDTSQGITASEYLNVVDLTEFETILYQYADEKWARRIAEKLGEFRKERPVQSTFDLVEIVDRAIPKKVRLAIRGHSAKRTFQAVRIAINDEIKPLQDALESIISALKSGGRLCVLTFHSIEDRIVKNYFKSLENPCTCPPKAPICTCGKKPVGRCIIRKAMLPKENEVAENIRSHSAKLRIFEKY